MAIIFSQTRFGRFLLFEKDYASQRILENRFLDFSLQEQIDKYVRADSVCIDVGANLGFVSVYLSKRCKKVYAVEPQNVVFQQLCANLFLNQCFNVEPLRLAGATKQTKFKIASKEKQEILNFSNNYHDIDNIGGIALEEDVCGEIIGDRIENHINSLEKIRFIKCDAQGGDYDAMLGLENCILRDRPIIVYECESSLSQKCYGRTIGDYINFFNKLNYKTSPLPDGNTLAIPSENNDICK